MWYHTAVALMRFSMVLKNEHRVYIVRNKVPRDLQEAVASATARGGKRSCNNSLKTKDGEAEKHKAPAVLMHFNTVLARDSVLAEDQPYLSSLRAAACLVRIGAELRPFS